MTDQNGNDYIIGGLKLRQLTVEDAVSIMEVQEVTLQSLPDPLWYYPSAMEQFAECCAGGECFGYFSRGKLVGFATLTPSHARPQRCYAGKLNHSPENTYDVQDVMVLPKFRRRGVHSALLRLFEETAYALGSVALYATIAPDNLPSVSSFEKAGYERVAVQPAYDGRMRAYYCKRLRSE